jgi:hypothetical protein
MLNKLKKTFDYALFAFVLTMAFAVGITAQTDQSLPTLRGDEAIEQLKQNGQYNSLKEAVKAARKDDGQTNNEPAENIIQETDKLFASDGGTFDFLGTTMGMSGDTVIIGSYGDDVNGNDNQGSAYIFVRSGATWTQQAKLIASDGTAGDQFGTSVAISGNTVIIGAPADTNGSAQSLGSVYIYVRLGTTWTQQRKFTGTNGLSRQYFGQSVAISDDTAIVSALYDNVTTNGGQGAAYVYVRSGTTWTQQAKLVASDGALNDYFGISLAISGNTVVVGANGDDIGTITDQGSAYVFNRSGTTWTQQQKLTALDGSNEDKFGYSVGISDNKIIVGAYWDDVGNNPNQGTVYIFNRLETNWTQQRVRVADGGAYDNFGQSVAVSGTKIIVGAPGSDISAPSSLTKKINGGDVAPQAADQGGVYFYTNTLSPTAAGVSISGHVQTVTGAGLQNATVQLTLANGETRTMRTGSFGNYRFDNIGAGQVIIVSVTSKKYRFSPRIVSIIDNLTDINFIAEN